MSEMSLGTARGTIKIDADTKGIAAAGAEVDAFKAKTSATSAAWGTAAKGMAIGGAVIAGGLALAVKSAADFEQGLSNISAVSGATDAEMEKIRQTALRLGADTQYSAGEAASAMEELIKAGISTKDVMNGAADATVNLAAAGEVDLTAAAGIAANAMNTFQLAAKDMPHVADLLAGAANASSTDVTALGEALKYAGPAAAAAGISLDDTVTAMAAFAKYGIEGSMAGTSFRGVMLNLIPSTDSAASAMKQLGILTEDGRNKFIKANGDYKSMAQVSEVLKKSTDGLAHSEKVKALNTIFGDRAMSGAIALSREGAKGFKELGDAMGNVSASEVAAQKMDNLKGSIEQMRGSIETAAITLGTALLPVVRTVVDAVTKLVNWFGGLSSHTQTVIATVLAVTGVLLLLGAGLIKAVQFGQKFSATVKTMATVLNAEKRAQIASSIAKARDRVATIAHTAADLASRAATTAKMAVERAAAAVQRGALAIQRALTLGNLKLAASYVAGKVQIAAQTVAMLAQKAAAIAINAATKAWAAAQWLLNAAMSANPIGLVIIAVVALIAAIVLLWRNSETFRTIVLAVWEAIKTAFAAAVAFIVPLVQSAWNFIKNGIVTAFNAYKTIISTAFNIIKTIFTTYVRVWWTIIKTAFNIIKTVITTAVNIYKAIIRTAWNIIKAVFRAAMKYIINPVRAGFNIIKTVVKTVFSAVKAVILGAWNFIKDKFSEGVAFVMGIWNRIQQLWHIAQAVFNKVVSIVKDKIASVISTIREVPGKILGFFADAGTMLYDAGKAIIQGLIDGIGAMFSALGDKMGAVGSFITDHLPGSPAKRGPLAGHGGYEMRHRGKSMMDQLLEGIRDRQKLNREMSFVVRDINSHLLQPGSPINNITVNPARVNVPAPQIIQNVYGNHADDVLDRSARRLRDIVHSGVMRGD